MKVKVPAQARFRAGVLKLHLEEWENITQDQFTLQSIVGVHIHTVGTPAVRPPSKVELQQRNTDPVVDQNIKDLLQLGAIKKVSSEEDIFISRVFTVPKVERGVEYARRFILNLKVSFQNH